MLHTWPTTIFIMRIGEQEPNLILVFFRSIPEIGFHGQI